MSAKIAEKPSIADLVAEVRQLQAEVSELRAAMAQVPGVTCLVPERDLPRLTGASPAVIRRFRRSGQIRAYGGTQPVKKRYLFDVQEVVAALKGDRQPTRRLNFDVKRLFALHGIPPDRALCG